MFFNAYVCVYIVIFFCIAEDAAEYNALRRKKAQYRKWGTLLRNTAENSFKYIRKNDWVCLRCRHYRFFFFYRYFIFKKKNDILSYGKNAIFECWFLDHFWMLIFWSFQTFEQFDVMVNKFMSGRIIILQPSFKWLDKGRFKSSLFT